MERKLTRIFFVLALLIGSTTLAAVVFKEQVTHVLFSDAFDDY